MPSYPLTGFDTVNKYNRHISVLSTIDAKNDRYLTALKAQARDNFQALNRRMGLRASKQVTTLPKTQFSYGAFRRKINGESFGVSKVVQDKKARRFEAVLQGKFSEMGDEIKNRKFYDEVRKVIEGFAKPLGLKQQSQDPTSAAAELPSLEDYD